jgi:predicted O-methyltransferase YrrM
MIGIGIITISSISIMLIAMLWGLRKAIFDEGIKMPRTLQTAISLIKKGQFGRAKNSILMYSAIPYYKHHLKNHKYKYPESLEFSWNSYHSLIKPAQKKPEIKEFLELIKNRNPKTFLEVGTGKGGTLFLFCSVLSRDAKIVTLDMRGGSYGAGYPPMMRKLIRLYTQGQKLSLIEGDSHKEETKDKIEKIFKKKIDFLFIDADHTYEGAKRDFELYSQLVKKGGTIALHDIKAYEQGCGVYKLWDELKSKYKTFEIVDKENPYGIGIIEWE